MFSVPGPHSTTYSSPLSAGAVLRQASGELFKVEGVQTGLDTQEQFALIRAYDAPKDDIRYLCPVSEIGEPLSTDKRFSLVPAPAKKHLLKFWRAYFRDMALLEVLTSRYEETWRYAYDLRYLHRIFERADQLGLKLSVEDLLGVLLYRAGHVPGLAPAHHTDIAENLAKCLAPRFSVAKINWNEIWKAWNEAGPSRIRDVLSLPFACDPLEFCVNEELQWLEVKPLAGPDGRKEFETQRLKALLGLASKGPIFTQALAEQEKTARINIEGLRQAWLKKYSPAAA